MEDLYDPEEKILCPYNSSHHIRRCRMSFHLVKCKKNYGEQKLVPCDFNVTHMIPEPELRYHHQICSDRKKLESQIVESQMITENKFPIPKLDCQADENWDNENVQTYDPKKYTETRDILRHIDVESGAKKKNFRLSERQRLGGLQQTFPQRQAEAVVKNLPSHRTVTNVTVNDDKLNPAMFQRKLKLDNKVYVQYKGESSNHE